MTNLDPYTKQQIKKFREKWKRIESTIKSDISGRKIWDADTDDDEANYLFVDETLESFIIDLIADTRREERERVEEFLKDQMANCSQYRSNSSSFKACRIYNKQLLVVMNKLLNSSDKGKCKEHAVFISCDHVSYKCDICCKCGAPTVFNGKVLNSTDTTE